MAKCPYCGAGIARYFLSRKCPKCGEALGSGVGDDQTLGSSLESSEFLQDESSSPERADEGTVGTVEIDLQSGDGNSSESDSESPLLLSKLDQATVVLDGSSEEQDDTNATIQMEQVKGEGGFTTAFIPLAKANTEDPHGTVDGAALNVRNDMTVAFDPQNTDGNGRTPDPADATVILPQNSDTSSSIFDSSQQSKLWKKQLEPSGGTPVVSVADKVADSFYGRLAQRNLVYESGEKSAQADYQVKHVLAEGGQGAVFVATQSCLGREVAVKFIKKAAVDKGVDTSKLGRLINEAEITASLGHPNVLPIHELAVTDKGEIFYSMKKVDGKDWSEALENEEATLEENVEFLLKVCDAIAFAHSKNVIHRDLKPENVMVGKFGEVLVADWGMAVDLNKLKDFKATNEQPFPFVPGGSIRYMSPEMAKHDWPRINHLSDIYLLGAMLYQLIEKTYIRQAETSKKGIALARENFIEPPKSSSKLIPVAMKAMSASPKDRYQSVEEFQDAIREVNRHAESERLELQASSTLAAAIEKSDSEKFNEAIFGFRSALELWPANDTAVLGLKKARLAYANDAFKRNNFDVCLEVLDPKAADEKDLYEKAVKGQRDARSREKSYRVLKYGSLIGASIAFVALSGLWWRAVDAKNKESVAKEKLSETVTQLEVKNGELDKSYGELQKKNEEIENNREVLAAKNTELSEKQIALEDEQKKLKESIEKEIAAQVLAKKNEEVAKTNEGLAKQNARQAELGRYQSSLVSAFSLNRSFNAQRSNELLADIGNVQENMEVLAKVDMAGDDGKPVQTRFEPIPQLYNWASHRVATLNNDDLPRFDWKKARVSCLDVSPDGRWAVMGTSEGSKSELIVLEYTAQGKREVVKKASMEYNIVSASISADGTEVALLIRNRTATAQPTLYYWNLSTDKPVIIPVAQNREFHWLAFSPDGKTLCVGLKDGLWVWQRDKLLDLEKVEKYKCFGELLAIQFLRSEGGEVNKAFCTARRVLTNSGKDSQLVFYDVDFKSDPGKAVRTITLDESLAATATCGVQVDERGAVLIGATDGRVFFAERVEENEKIKLKVTDELPKMQQAGVKTIREFGFSRIAVVRADSAIELWERDPAAVRGEGPGWKYIQSLLGLSTAAVDARFSRDGKFATTVDNNGLCIDYDLEEQKLRSKVPSAVGLFDSVLATGGSGRQGNAWAIDELGAVHVWWPSQPEKLALQSYPGHTPNAAFADAAISEQAGIMVTAAVLGERSKNYRNSEQPKQEICVWDLKSGNMLHRWHREVTSRPKIGLAAEGKFILVADEKSAELVSLDGETRTSIASSSGTPSYVAVLPHPKEANLVALLTAQSGVLLYDVVTKSTVGKVNNDLVGLRAATMPAMTGAWSPDGSRIYVLRSKSDGSAKALAALDWNGSELTKSAVADALRLPGDPASTKTDFEANVAGLHRVDLVVNQSAGKEIVQFALRGQFDGGRAIVGTLLVGEGLQTVEYRPEYTWIASTGEILEENQIKKRLGPSFKFISKFLGLHGNTLSLIEGNIDALGVDITDFTGYVVGTQGDLRTLQNYGRAACVLALGEESGQRWYTINGKNGTFELFEASLGQDGVIRWSLVRDLVSQALQGDRPVSASMSSDGRYLLLCSSKQTAAIDLQAQNIVHKWPDYQHAQWKPMSNEFVLARSDGSLKFASLEQLEGTESKIDVEAGKEVVKISWHRENLRQQDEQITKWHVVVLEKMEDSEGLAFYEVNGNQLRPEQPPMRITRSSISAFTSSPLDGTLAIGTSLGDISLWFVSPTVDNQARELFSIDEHRGVKVSDLRFSKDGSTLYSGDAPASNSSKSRAHGWTAIMTAGDDGSPIASK